MASDRSPRTVRPPSGRSSPVIERSLAVFPQTDGPISVNNSPSSTSELAPPTAETCLPSTRLCLNRLPRSLPVNSSRGCQRGASVASRVTNALATPCILLWRWPRSAAGGHPPGELDRVAFSVVQAYRAQQPGVLDRQVTGSVGLVEVEMLVPRTSRRREQCPLRQLDGLDRLALVVDRWVAIPSTT